MPADLDERAFETTVDLFGMPAAPTRLRNVCTLVEGERSVSELLDQVAVSRPGKAQPQETP